MKFLRLKLKVLATCNQIRVLCKMPSMIKVIAKTVLVIYCLSTIVLALPDESLIDVTIPKGATAQSIAGILKDKGIIRYPLAFRIYLKTTGAGADLRAGIFSLGPRFSMKRIIRVLLEKEGAASLTRITIPEGFTLTEIAETLQDKGIIRNADEFVLFTNTEGKKIFKDEFSFLAEVPTNNLEGYLFPDTYIFAKGAPREEILRKFLTTFEKKILPVWQEKPHRLGLHKALTLASIVEKEAYDRSEMPTIAGVFHNRLRRRMVLASCPTVGYAMGEPRKRFLTYQDIKFKSVYNTYQRQGLPPTPIASPGVQAFRATLTPKTTPYLFFVSNGDGTHTFTKTLKSHLSRQQEILQN